MTRAWWTIGWIRTAQAILPYARLMSILERPPGRPRTNGPSPRELSRAVLRASFWFPDAATCLPQALALRHLLARQGFDATLRKGVARTADGAVEAHAWVEMDGEILIGKEEVERYTPLDRPAPR